MASHRGCHIAHLKFKPPLDTAPGTSKCGSCPKLPSDMQQGSFLVAPHAGRMPSWPQVSQVVKCAFCRPISWRAAKTRCTDGSRPEAPERAHPALLAQRPRGRADCSTRREQTSCPGPTPTRWSHPPVHATSAFLCSLKGVNLIFCHCSHALCIVMAVGEDPKIGWIGFPWV